MKDLLIIVGLLVLMVLPPLLGRLVDWVRAKTAKRVAAEAASVGNGVRSRGPGRLPE